MGIRTPCVSGHISLLRIPLVPRETQREDEMLRSSSIVPSGLVAESALLEGEFAVVVVRSPSAESSCRARGAESLRVHSRYRRRVADFPLSGRRVQLHVLARRFRCDAVLLADEYSKNGSLATIIRSSRPD